MKITDLKKGFNYFKLVDEKWIQFEIINDLTNSEKYTIFEEYEKGLIKLDLNEDKSSKRKLFFKKIEPYYHAIYSSLFSFAFLFIFFICIYLLNYLDLQYNNAQGLVMPTGDKILQLILYVLSIHTGAVVIANVLDWSTSNFKSYVYKNPFLFKLSFDETEDLNSIHNNPTAKFRFIWYQLRFYIFYFVSIFLVYKILWLKMTTGFN